MRILFVVNLEKRNAKNCAEQAIQVLESSGAECYLEAAQSDVFDSKKFRFAHLEESYGDFDIIVAVGGDGTIMDVGKQAVLFDKPVLGINAGRLGFMAGVEADNFSCLTSLVSGNYVEQPRMLLEVIHQSEFQSETYIAVNDLLIAKSALTSIIDVDILCDGKLVNEYRADSILFATPTGSTAYSLSNGGPIADPMLSYISMSPICPHSFASRTYLFQPGSQLSARLGANNRNQAYFLVDGQVISELKKKDSIKITASQRKMRLISLNHRSFYEVVSQKFVVN